MDSEYSFFFTDDDEDDGGDDDGDDDVDDNDDDDADDDDDDDDDGFNSDISPESTCTEKSTMPFDVVFVVDDDDDDDGDDDDDDDEGGVFEVDFVMADTGGRMKDALGSVLTLRCLIVT